MESVWLLTALESNDFACSVVCVAGLHAAKITIATKGMRCFNLFIIYLLQYYCQKKHPLIKQRLSLNNKVKQFYNFTGYLFSNWSDLFNVILWKSKY